MVAVGERLPEGAFKVKQADGTVADVAAKDFFGGRKVVLVGVPGAFTSTCHNAHVPRFVANAAAFKARGVDRVAVMAVNDQHVMKAWRESLDPDGAVDFLADGSAAYATALGLTLDLSAGGLGLRCRRFAMIVDDGVVKYLFVEDKPGEITGSGAAAVLEAL